MQNFEIANKVTLEMLQGSQRSRQPKVPPSKKSGGASSLFARLAQDRAPPPQKRKKMALVGGARTDGGVVTEYEAELNDSLRAVRLALRSLALAAPVLLV